MSEPPESAGTLRADLTLASPLGQLREGRLPRRLVQLYAGLALYGFSMGLMIRATLGLGPWDVLHQGVVDRTGLTFGTIVFLTSLVVLLLWIPLRQWPGLGTVSNPVVIAVTVDLTLALIDPPAHLAVRIAFAVAGVVLNAVATAAYVGTRLGPGPRDGLMTGLVRTTGRSVRLVRTLLEGSVLLIGWLLGGPIGATTVLYAFGIGPLTQLLLPFFVVSPARSRP